MLRTRSVDSRYDWFSPFIHDCPSAGSLAKLVVNEIWAFAWVIVACEPVFEFFPGRVNAEFVPASRFLNFTPMGVNAESLPASAHPTLGLANPSDIGCGSWGTIAAFVIDRPL